MEFSCHPSEWPGLSVKQGEDGGNCEDSGEQLLPMKGTGLRTHRALSTVPGACCCFCSFSLPLMNSVRQQELLSQAHSQRPNGHLAALQGTWIEICARSRTPTFLLPAHVILTAPFSIQLPGYVDESEKPDHVLAAFSQAWLNLVLELRSPSRSFLS